MGLVGVSVWVRVRVSGQRFESTSRFTFSFHLHPLNLSSSDKHSKRVRDLHLLKKLSASLDQARLHEGNACFLHSKLKTLFPLSFFILFHGFLVIVAKLMNFARVLAMGVSGLVSLNLCFFSFADRAGEQQAEELAKSSQEALVALQTPQLQQQVRARLV